jgi:hypothetical protein
MTPAASHNVRSPVPKRVTPPLRKALLIAHLLTAVGLVGLAVALTALGLAGLAGQDPETIYPAMHLLAGAALVPLGILALLIGIAQALLTSYGLFKHWWVTTKLAILTLLVVVAIAIAVPGLGRAADAATDPAAAVATAQQVTATITPITALVLFAVAATLGVVKPGRAPSPAVPGPGTP